MKLLIAADYYTKKIEDKLPNGSLIVTILTIYLFSKIFIKLYRTETEKRD